MKDFFIRLFFVIIAIVLFFLAIYAGILFNKKFLKKDVSPLSLNKENIQELGGNLSPADPKYLQEKLAPYQKTSAFLEEASPYSGIVSIIEVNSSQIPEEEYLIIENNEFSNQDVPITGWTIEVVDKNLRAPIPDGVKNLKINDINQTYQIILKPGQKAIVNTGSSPIGVSFLENMCTGYLNNFQKFYPPLKTNCPKNITSQDVQCDLFIQSQMPPCFYPTQALKRKLNLSDTCANFIKNNYNYHTCKLQNQSNENFFSDTWRIYLNVPVSLYSNAKIIRLLDNYGRVVDIIEN